MLGSLIALPSQALEVLTAEDFIEGIVVEDQLVRIADNAIFLVDTSSSMNDEYEDTGKSKLELVTSEFKKRNGYFPDLGHKFGIYEYTPWKVLYPLKDFDRDEVAAALASLPEKGSGATPLAAGVEKVTEVIENLTGRTVLFLFYDGQYTGRDPNPALWRLIKENDVCLMMVSSAGEEENAQMAENLSRLNSCSRLVSYGAFLNRPEYTTHALYDVVATEKIITKSEQRISGVLVDNINFGFDKTELTAADKEELDALGEFMADNAESYAVLAGYTDNIGIEDYNEHLSQMRAEMVAGYLMDKHGIDESRFVLYWHGSDNPVASNDTADGRAKNRRVEIGVGGL